MFAKKRWRASPGWGIMQASHPAPMIHSGPWPSGRPMTALVLPGQMPQKPDSRTFP